MLLDHTHFLLYIIESIDIKQSKKHIINCSKKQWESLKEVAYNIINGQKQNYFKSFNNKSIKILQKIIKTNFSSILKWRHQLAQIA